MKYMVVVAVLSVIIIFLIIRLFIIKGNIRQVRNELKKTKDEGYNRQLRVSLMDKDVESLAGEINSNLDYQKNLKLETEKSRRQLEQSISDIAHDLRTPLTVVKGNLQMLEQEPLSEKGRAYLDISVKKSEDLKGMVDEFFELSVLESDSKPAELTKIDIVAFLAEFIIENETLIRNAELTPEITFPEKSVFINANKEMLSRVFNNLIGNILKYAEGSFELVVEEMQAVDSKSDVKSDGRSDSKSDSRSDNKFVGGCHIRVGNKVSNPASIDIDHIFDRTYRADKTRSAGNAGLGLYIARLLVEKQKGSMTACMEGDKLYFDIVF